MSDQKLVGWEIYVQMEAKQKIDLDAPLARFGADSKLTLRDACQGILITGGIGSGKTTGSYAFLLKRMLKSQMGGLILTVKPQEVDEYRKLCIEAGREQDLIEICPSGEHGLNWLEYESSTKDSDKPLTDNILEIFKAVIKAGAEQDVGRGDDGFWQQSIDLLIGHVIDLCILAYGRITLDDMYHIVQSLPKPKFHIDNQTDGKPTAFDKAFEQAKTKTNAKRHKWHNSLSDDARKEKLSEGEFIRRLHSAVPETRQMDFLYEFFFDTYKNLSEKTRSVITIIFSGFLYSLMREPVYSLFSNKTTVTPEDCYSGKIVLVSLPVKKFHEVGRNSQIIMKLVFQRAWEKRTITDHSPCVFLASDESYTFVHEHDTLFQATSRSARVCTIAVTQNLGNYYSAMGGEKAKYRVNSLIGTYSTKIFHANADTECNEYSSKLIGDAYFYEPSINVSMAAGGPSRGQNVGMKLERIYRPEFFVSLKSGGPSSNYEVQAVIHKQGEPIKDGSNHALILFKQNINS